MNINTHTHLFTLRNVLSREAVRAIGNRLRHKNVPEYLVKGIENFIHDLSNKPRHLTEDQLLEELIKAIISTDLFQNFASNHLHQIPALNAININNEHLSQAALKQVLNSLSAWGDANDNSESNLFDIYETLRIALKPNSTDITDHLLSHLTTDDALVGLMMDIRGDNESDRDKQRFHDQRNDLIEANLQRPGRLFLFFAVNPKRSDHFDLMKDALENRGFVGVKLYPSLGYQVDSPKMMNVYAYCEEHDIPITMHCNHTGFYVEEDFIDYCNPVHWETILAQHPTLKICFAHFDGHETLSHSNGFDDGTWGKKILDLMENDDYTGVYADVSYHTDMMGEPGLEVHYLQTLNNLLNRPVVQDRILFGTDSWLLRLNMSDELFWSYFRDKLSNQQFKRIASNNPKVFLGIEPLKKNFEWYINFHKKNRKNVGAQPNSWLHDRVDAEFTMKRDHPNWTVQKYPALIVIAAIGSQMYSKQKEQAFSRRAYITMQELKFWDFAFVDQSAFDQECKKMSLDLVNQCEAEGKLEGQWTVNEARAKYESMIRQNSTRLLDLSCQIDVMYNFTYDE
ncbi:amidohydrolase [Aliifodinibius salicampi]|uniref:Amidohydrolase n=1 Tax=Fodinibius salicampi TaxID=1920655 RepID=A0ABT3PYP1_9BACT|nr:amidohydrolase family protein [Fodinibius salicampi]MCW9712906.1 amidohydrolase [Fodinibius salicampi]